MKPSLNAKFKVIITIVLSLIVVGIALASIFGFNNTVDYKDSYEVVVGINQKIEDKATAAKNSVDNYFASKGLRPLDCYTQTINEGSRYVYKFDIKTELDVNDLKSAVEKAVNDSSIGIVCEVNEVKDVSNKAQLNVVWVLCIAIAIGLIYLAFVEKFASAVSVIFTSITASVLFVALLGITRVPAYPFLSLNLLVTFAITFILSIVLARRFKELVTLSGDEAFNKYDIINKASQVSLKRFILFAIVGVIFSLAIAIWGSYLTILGLQFVLAIASSLLTSFAFMPVFWLLLKKVK